jgi:hypothetical protein
MGGVIRRPSESRVICQNHIVKIQRLSCPGQQDLNLRPCLALPAGFEPAVSGVRVRDPWPLDDGSVIGSGRRIRTCRILINSQAHPPRTVDRNKLVEPQRIELCAAILQGSPVTHDWPRTGAWGWFRANLSAFSARCFHQISFPGEMVERAGLEPASPVCKTGALPVELSSHVELVRTVGFEPTPPDRHSGTLPLSHVRDDVCDRAGCVSIARGWWAGMELNHHSRRRGVYSALGSPVPSLPEVGGR